MIVSRKTPFANLVKFVRSKKKFIWIIVGVLPGKMAIDFYLLFVFLPKILNENGWYDFKEKVVVN